MRDEVMLGPVMIGVRWSKWCWRFGASVQFWTSPPWHVSGGLPRSYQLAAQLDVGPAGVYLTIER